MDIRVHHDVRGFVEDKVANMVKRHPKATQQCRDMWATEHTLITEKDATRVGRIPDWAKPTFCSNVRCGTCICRGPGLTAELAAKRLCILSPGCTRSTSRRRSARRRWGRLTRDSSEELLHVSIIWVPTGSKCSTPSKRQPGKWRALTSTTGRCSRRSRSIFYFVRGLR